MAKSHTHPSKPAPHAHGQPIAWDPQAPRRRNATWLVIIGALFAIGGGWLWWRGKQLERTSPILPLHPGELGADLKLLLDRQIAMVKANPSDAKKHGMLGLAYEANRLWPEARLSYSKAADLDPNDPNWPYHAALAKYYLDGDMQGAMAELRQVTVRYPNYPPAQYRLGDFLLDANDLDGAQSAFLQTIASAPKAADGYVGLGDVLLRRNDLEGATQQLERALAIEPDYKLPHYLLGQVLHKQGQLERAKTELAFGVDSSKRVMLDPVAEHINEYSANVDVRITRAIALLNMRRIPEARGLLEQILSDHSDNTRALMTLGVLLLQQNQAAEALAVLQRADAISPQDSKVKVNLSACYLALKRASDARSAAQLAIALEPGLMQAQAQLAQACVMAGDLEAALAPMQKAVDLAPNDPDLLGRLALLEKETKRYAEARVHNERLTELTPDNWQPWGDLVEIHIELGDLEAAQRALDNVRRLAPSEPSIPKLTRLLEERRGK